MSTTGDPILPGSPDWELDPKFAHPRARKLFEEAFFWDAIDDHAPWGSDEGADALAFFGQAHSHDGGPPDPVAFAKEYVAENWSEQRPSDALEHAQIETFSAAHLAVIAIVLGMYLIHGYVPPDLKAFGLEAIDRELQPNCLHQFGEPDERAAKLLICRDRLIQAEIDPPTPDSLPSAPRG
jgi:uncharacterized protein YfeS